MAPTIKWPAQSRLSVCSRVINRSMVRPLAWFISISQSVPRKIALRHRLLPKLKTRIEIVGAPLVYGQPLDGSDAAPELLRSLQLIPKLKSKGAEVVDHGDLKFKIVADDVETIPGCKHVKTVGLAAHKIAHKVNDIVETGKMCLLLGGDHSVSIGSVYGHMQAHPDAAIIWVDAHSDINTPMTSSSGNLHGMVLSFLMKELPCPSLPGLEWCEPCISADRIGYIGLRSVDPGEQEFLNKLNICQFGMDDVRNLGIDQVMRRLLGKIDPRCNRPLHLSFDVDALDPYHIPATGTPVPGGLSLREAFMIARTVHHTGRLSVMDVVELNPLLASQDIANWSAEITVEFIVRSFFGKRWKPDAKYLRHLFPND